MITRRDVAEKLIDYLYHRITEEESVDWAEEVMMKEEFEEKHHDTLREIVAHLGVADVQAFGLNWDTIEDCLERLGYRVQVKVSETLSSPFTFKFLS